jgi:hypothetical protein
VLGRGALVVATVVAGAAVAGGTVVDVLAVVDVVDVDAVVLVDLVTRDRTVLARLAPLDEPPQAPSVSTSASAPNRAGIRGGIRSVA